MDKLQIKRSIALTSISVIVTFIAFLQITKHSNIKTTEVLIILVLGMGISALIFNLAHLYKIKIDAKITHTQLINISKTRIFRNVSVLIKSETTEVASITDFN